MGGDDFNKSDSNGRNTGKSIDLLKKIVNEKRNSEHLEREEQVNAMFERILEISDIENKIIAKIDYNLDNNGTDADNNITINLSLPYLWTGIPEKILRILYPPHERDGGEVQFGAYFESLQQMSEDQRLWFHGDRGYARFQIEHFSNNKRLKHYNDISLRLQEYFKGTTHHIVEGSYEIRVPGKPSQAMFKPVLKLTVSW